MIILRQNIFSKSKNKNSEDDEKKNDKKRKLKGAGLVAAGAGVALAASGGTDKATEKFLDKATEHISTKGSQDKELIEKLTDRAKNQGIKIIRDENFDNSAYLGTNEGKFVDKLDKRFKKYTGKDDYFKENLGKSVGLGKEARKEVGKDTIVMGIGDKNPAVLAHEMGHAAMLGKKRSKDIIGKTAHSKLGEIVGIPDNIISNPDEKIRKVGEAGFLGAGIIHGVKSAKREEEGDLKKARIERRKGIIRSAIIVSPRLISEAAASRKGMKYLKESGASKDTLKQSRKVLGNAFGTYASQALKPVALEAGGTAIGYGAHKLISKSKKKKEKKKDDNTKD